MFGTRFVLALSLSLVLSAPEPSSSLTAIAGESEASRSTSYRLYRTSWPTVGPVYIATFDAKDSDPFNEGNCVDTARLHTENATRYPAKLRFWCEER